MLGNKTYQLKAELVKSTYKIGNKDATNVRDGVVAYEARYNFTMHKHDNPRDYVNAVLGQIKDPGFVIHRYPVGMHVYVDKVQAKKKEVIVRLEGDGETTAVRLKLKKGYSTEQLDEALAVVFADSGSMALEKPVLLTMLDVGENYDSPGATKVEAYAATINDVFEDSRYNPGEKWDLRDSFVTLDEALATELARVRLLHSGVKRIGRAVEKGEHPKLKEQELATANRIPSGSGTFLEIEFEVL